MLEAFVLQSFQMKTKLNPSHKRKKERKLQQSVKKEEEIECFLTLEALFVAGSVCDDHPRNSWISFFKMDRSASVCIFTSGLKKKKKIQRLKSAVRPDGLYWRSSPIFHFVARPLKVTRVPWSSTALPLSLASA